MLSIFREVRRIKLFPFFRLGSCENVGLSSVSYGARSEIYDLGKNSKSASFEVNKNFFGQAVRQEMNC